MARATAAPTCPNDFANSHAVDRDSRTYEPDCAIANAEAPRRFVSRDRTRQYLGVDRVRTLHESIRTDDPTDNHLPDNIQTGRNSLTSTDSD
jgi:hypothetical protein